MFQCPSNAFKEPAKPVDFFWGKNEGCPVWRFPIFLYKKSQFNYTKLVIFFQIAKDLCLFFGVIIDVKKDHKKAVSFYD